MTNRKKIVVLLVSLLLILGIVMVVFWAFRSNQVRRLTAVLARHANTGAKAELASEVASIVRVGEQAKRYQAILAAATAKEEHDSEGEIAYTFVPKDAEQEWELIPYVIIVVDKTTKTIDSVYAGFFN